MDARHEEKRRNVFAKKKSEPFWGALVRVRLVPPLIFQRMVVSRYINRSDRVVRHRSATVGRMSRTSHVVFFMIFFINASNGGSSQGKSFYLL